MAHTDACKIQTTQFTKKLIDKGISDNKAIKLTAKEADIPEGTVRRWWYELYPPQTYSKMNTPEIEQTLQEVDEISHGFTVTETIEPESPVSTKVVEIASKKMPMFNRQKGDGIKWAGWSWNPVTGCLHGCDYCYARAFANRYREMYPKGFKPHFRKERLTAPQNTPLPVSDQLVDRLVFTVSMGDLFGEWVPQEWIDAVLESIRQAPQWTFLMLTKNPARLLTIDFPENCWVGATADTQDRATEAVELFYSWKNRPSVLFLSCEPLIERIDLMAGSVLGKSAPASCLDWLIIGGQTGTIAKQPEWEWVELLLDQARENDIAVYFKPNLSVRPKEYPGGLG